VAKGLFRKLQRGVQYGYAMATRRKIDDEFITWLSFANAGMLNPGNAYLMDLAVEQAPEGGAFIEIGSFCGLSTNCILHFMRRHGRKNTFFTCDKWAFENSDGGGTLGDSPLQHAEYREFVKTTYMRNVGFFGAGERPRTIEVFSDEFFDLWRRRANVSDVFGRDVELGGPISFAYIDGNHTYEFAKRDWQNVDEFLLPGGFVLFDDSASYLEFEVYPVVRELQRDPNYELVATNPNHLLRKRA